MRSKPSSLQVESYCNSCHVSFPVDARRCSHCGGRLARERLWTGSADPAGVVPAPVPEEHFEEVQEEAPRRAGISPFTLVWIALLLAGYLYRSCVS
jgi:ribosomal protein L37E